MKCIRVIIILLSAIALIAASDGVAEDQNRDRTGSPDGSNTCAQCHTGGGFNPSVSITLRDASGIVVNAYQADSLYDVRVMVSSFPFPSVFGFQATALFDDGENAGTFSAPGPAVQLEEVNTMTIPSRHIAEHSQPSPVGVFNFQWTAPSSTAQVTFYASGTTCNSDGDSSGDNGANTSITVSADIVDSVFKGNDSDAFWTVSIQDGQLQLYHPLISRAEQMTIYTLSGQVVLHHEQLDVPSQWSLASLSSGIYLVHLSSALSEQAIKLYVP